MQAKPNNTRQGLLLRVSAVGGDAPALMSDFGPWADEAALPPWPRIRAAQRRLPITVRPGGKWLFGIATTRDRPRAVKLS